MPEGGALVRCPLTSVIKRNGRFSELKPPTSYISFYAVFSGAIANNTNISLNIIYILLIRTAENVHLMFVFCGAPPCLCSCWAARPHLAASVKRAR